jgi:hypothetical protein
MMRGLRHYSAFSLATCLCLMAGVISPAWSREIITSGEKLTLERAIELTLKTIRAARTLRWGRI